MNNLENKRIFKILKCAKLTNFQNSTICKIIKYFGCSNNFVKMKNKIRKQQYRITHLSLFQNSFFSNSEISVVLHLVVLNFHPHPSYKNYKNKFTQVYPIYRCVKECGAKSNFYVNPEFVATGLFVKLTKNFLSFILNKFFLFL